MPILHWSHPEARAFHIVYSGHIAARDILRFFDQFEPDFQACPDYDEYCDLTAVTQTLFRPGELQRIYQLVSGIYVRNAATKRIAFLAPDDPARAPAQGFVDFMADRDGGPVVTRLDSRDQALSALDISQGLRHLFARH